VPNPYEVRHSTAADRLLKPSALPAGHLGSTSDEYEMFIGSSDTPRGRAVAPPSVPRAGADVRRLFGCASQGQESTWSDVASVAQDASGMVLSPKPAASPGTDVVTTGYILPYELADGGTIVVEAVGTYKCGSLTPRILANIRIGGVAVTPVYEVTAPASSGNLTDIPGASGITSAFEWSSLTCGLNALGGYHALFLNEANLTPGEFQWRLTVKIHALGRWAKWQRGDADSSTKDRTCWVEATLEWGGIQYNAGGRMGEGYGYYFPTSTSTTQYNAYMPSGVLSGTIYSFLGQQWLCHATNTRTALDAASNPDLLVPAIWTSMLADEAPGIGVHWREMFVPLVSKATISGFSTVDWTVGNEIQIELGGPQQVDLGTSFTAYNAATLYLPEVGTCSDGGRNYVAKTMVLAANFPRFAYDAGAATSESDTTGGVPTFTGTPGVSGTGERCWRELPATLRDTMRMQHIHGYLFGRRNGVAERRLG